MNWADNFNLESLIRSALKEDIGLRDITTSLVVPLNTYCKARLVAQENGIACGLGVAQMVFKLQDKNIRFIPRVKDGQKIKKGIVLAQIYGRARSILTAERVAVNFLSMLSGIATLTKRFTEKTKSYKTKIFDTRKTIPGLRSLEKYAVRVGGGYNHRFTLEEMVLIKDNHIAAIRTQRHKDTSISKIIRDVKKKVPKKIKIEVEVKNLKEFKDALGAKPDIIMLDNMKIADIKKAVSIRNSNFEFRNSKLEVSGGVTLRNVRQISAIGVDMISIGALTHSYKAMDICLDISV